MGSETKKNNIFDWLTKDKLHTERNSETVSGRFRAYLIKCFFKCFFKCFIKCFFISFNLYSNIALKALHTCTNWVFGRFRQPVYLIFFWRELKDLQQEKGEFCGGLTFASYFKNLLHISYSDVMATNLGVEAIIFCYYCASYLSWRRASTHEWYSCERFGLRDNIYNVGVKGRRISFLRRKKKWWTEKSVISINKTKEQD